MTEKFVLPRESVPGDAHTAEYNGQTIDVYKLIRLAEELETTTVPVASLGAEKQNNFWHDSQGDWLGPRDVLASLERVDDPAAALEDESIDPKLREHIAKVLKADYVSYPVILIDGKVIDGTHRLTKAFVDGAETMSVKHFSDLPEEVIVSN